MSEKKTGDGDGKGLSDADRALWGLVSDGVNPLPGRAVPAKPSVRANKVVKKPKGQIETPLLSPPSTAPRSKEIDKALATKLRQGKLPIEGRLDLHGKTQDQAHRLIVQFILAAHKDGKKCVLIITGTGERTVRNRAEQTGWYESEPGVLKRRFHEFIHDPRIDDIVLQTQQAQPKDGGAGAFYVYLRSKSRVVKP